MITNARGLTCKELVELVTDYLEDSLSPEDRTRFEAHINACRGCSDHLKQMRTTIRLTGKLSENTIEPKARDEFLEIFDDWKDENE